MSVLWQIQCLEGQKVSLEPECHYSIWHPKKMIHCEGWEICHQCHWKREILQLIEIFHFSSATVTPWCSVIWKEAKSARGRMSCPSSACSLDGRWFGVASKYRNSIIFHISPRSPLGPFTYDVHNSFILLDPRPHLVTVWLTQLIGAFGWGTPPTLDVICGWSPFTAAASSSSSSLQPSSVSSVFSSTVAAGVGGIPERAMPVARFSAPSLGIRAHFLALKR